MTLGRAISDGNYKSATLAVAFPFLACAALAVGNLASHTAFNSTPAAPEVITYTYDELNRLQAKTVPVPGAVGIANTITYAYTPTGQVATVTDARGVTSYEYDARDRVTQVTHPEGWVLGFTYDAAGNRTTATLPNGTSTAWTYDQRNRVTRVEHRKGTTNVVTYTYVWNAQGLRSREIAVYAPSSHTCQSDHTYDALGRLTRTVIPSSSGTGNPCMASGTWNYTYDAVGNRLTETGSTSGFFSSTSSYDANDRLTAVTGTKGATYDYDAAGNVVRHTETTLAGLPPLVTEYRWDAEGRMVGVTPKLIPPTAINPNPEQPKPIAYLYDAEGQLVGEVRDTVVGTQPPPEKVTHYLPDKNLPFSQILEERDGTGALKAAYQFAGGMPLRQLKAGAAHFYHTDHLSVGVLTDATGAPQARYLYSPFGELVGNFSGTGTGVPTVGGTHLFAGERLNADSGLYYNRARWMDPRTGRFEALDPHPGVLTRPITLHDYAYAALNPVDFRDPSGRMGLGDSSTAGSIHSGLSSTANVSLRKAFGKFGCEVGAFLANQAVEYGIYILIDAATGGFYVGQAIDIDARHKRHIREAIKEGENLWKVHSKVVARFPVPGGPAALDKMEQLVIDILRENGEKLLNGRDQIGPRNSKTSWADYEKFKKAICK